MVGNDLWLAHPLSLFHGHHSTHRQDVLEREPILGWLRASSCYFEHRALCQLSPKMPVFTPQSLVLLS